MGNPRCLFTRETPSSGHHTLGARDLPPRPDVAVMAVGRIRASPTPARPFWGRRASWSGRTVIWGTSESACPCVRTAPSHLLDRLWQVAFAGQLHPLICCGSRSRTTSCGFPGLVASESMAYDEELAYRLRELLADEPALGERNMFGGLAFLIGGNMAIAASGQGGVLVRVDPAQSDKLVASSNAERAVMRGRPMGGWLRVAPEHVRTKRQLAKWATLGSVYARSLPPKQ